MAFVDKEQKVIREKINQAPGALSGLPTRHVSGVILNAIAKPNLSEHFQIVLGAHTNALGLQQQFVLLKVFYLSFELRFNGLARRTQFVLSCDILIGRVYPVAFHFFEGFAGDGIQFPD